MRYYILYSNLEIQFITTPPLYFSNTKKEDIYGIGKVRTLTKFFQCYGIHVQVKRTERRLCEFVQSDKIQELLHSHLRTDGMGIDYSKVFFRYHEKAVVKD